MGPPVSTMAVTVDVLVYTTAPGKCELILKCIYDMKVLLFTITTKHANEKAMIFQVVSPWEK